MSILFSTGTINFGFYSGLVVEGLISGEMETELGNPNVVSLGK